MIAILLSCSLGAGLLAGCSDKAESTPVKTTEQKVKKGNLEVGLGADGRISLPLVNLSFELSGTVKEIKAQTGQKVKKGEILAVLEDTDLKLAVTQAENALSKANAMYSEAANKYEIEKLDAKYKVDQAKAKWDARPDDLTLKAAYEIENKKYQTLLNSNGAIQSTSLEIEDAKNKLQEAKNNMNKIYLKAPINGEITTINYKVGEVVSGVKAGTDTNSAASDTAFMTIVDPSVIYIKASATESDISGIEKDQEMRVAIDSLKLENLQGKVVSVNSTPKIDSSGIVTYEVTGKLAEPNAAIKEGMTAFVTFLKKEKKDVLLVPNKAIFVEDGKQYVTVKTGEKTEKRAIRGGLTNGVQTEVTEGLKQGETIQIGGVKK
ncbi:efflux RND transporter periplasmic adaptor subunit [Fictibacillus fluitans]|uniref:HlyD family efflux transporter periplasmic adaptor subunit n=1 Tax=Fictibacillus fluitans TaxID=3058422 RepID=A0ABT8HRJ2_9BACL|nr:HlyD family efflux transporter periplasmic adaptor subunit [Fictibacillus sp. NE201]MDN4523354.1 HlyD family efflux transporter periplasmic adaptor subunit [Fictibacillus sp. NE201]